MTTPEKISNPWRKYLSPKKTVPDLLQIIDEFDRLLPDIPDEEADMERQAEQAAEDFSFKAYKQKIDLLRAELRGLPQQKRKR